MASQSTTLAYFEDMWQTQSHATFIASVLEGTRLALILDRTIFYPQGGGQPADHGWIQDVHQQLKFCVEDVRIRDGVVYHYGLYCKAQEVHEGTDAFSEGQEVCLYVDQDRRVLNSRLHSAGHLLDVCMQNLGLAYLEPGKGHHFLDGPFVEYKGSIPATELESTREGLETEINHLINLGGKVKANIVSYEEASAMCGSKLPSYISKEDKPRIVCLGENFGCPCGGTHVADISCIGKVKVTQIRVKKGVTKVSYCLAM
ncbi:hypothetical protein GOP47_0004980 [Adiantum capillus-veneris]|uniref:Alanyl-transfer RNA synthetases family profile domain-containing protein n=1 Tax=Adiantum capillus-veneris TaxID=13818 RepID=A0A9D4V4A9_ADICA|nr:hypothetical protein GOP47_0004980 [Adiantum capillus-veneris]